MSSNVVQLRPREYDGTTHGAAMAVHKTGDAANSALSSRDPLATIKNVLLQKGISTEDLYAHLAEHGIMPDVFADTLFTYWFTPGMPIPNVAFNLMGEYPNFLGSSSDWSLAKYGERKLCDCRKDPRAQQLVVIEWLHLLLGHSEKELPLQEEFLFHPEALKDRIGQYAILLGQDSNFPLSDRVDEVLLALNSINRIGVMLS